MFRISIVLMAAILLIAAAPITSVGHPQQNPIQHSSDTHEPPAPNQRGTEAAPIIIKMVHTPEGDKQAAEAATYKSEDARNNTLLVIFNGALAFVAALELVYIIRQENWMKKSVKAAQDAANAAQTSADAAIAANRPWIKVTAVPAGPLIINSDGITLKAVIHVENVGNSPATRVKVTTGLAARSESDKSTDALRSAVSRAEISHSERIVYDRPRSAEEIAALKTIGDAVFPNENREIASHDFGVSGDELRGIVAKDDEATMMVLYFAISAEYQAGSRWAVTTVVYALDNNFIGMGDEANRWRNRTAYDPNSVRLRKLGRYTTAS